MVSIGSVLICILGSVLLVFYLQYVLCMKNGIFLRGIKFVFIGIIAILIRMLIPINFSFTVNVLIKRILPDLALLIYKPLGGIEVFHIVLLIWGMGTIWKICKYIRQNYKFHRLLKQYQSAGQREDTYVQGILKKMGLEQISVVTLPIKISPSITGLFKPVLILPNQKYSDIDLNYIIKHEAEHYKNHDLWLKTIIQITECVYWWNPFIYLLKKKFYLAMELSNDMVVIQNTDDFEKMEYAECLVRVSRMNLDEKIRGNEIPFFSEKHDLAVRIKGITNVVERKRRASLQSLAFNLTTVILITFVCYVFALEPYRESEKVEQETITISEDNGYFVKSNKGYDLYVDEKYLTTLQNIEETLKDLAVYSEGETIKK
ncbi:MAG: M56 family metallopeptidase [Lachnospiraceae bacterium]|nr:M56 family metallopeptidase [Lachnospiraceae bacterium]